MSDRSGVVDLVVEDTVAEERERVKARKEGGAANNSVEPKRLVRQYPPQEAGEQYRVGGESPASVSSPAPKSHATQGDPGATSPFSIGDDDDTDSSESHGGAVKKVTDFADGHVEDSNAWRKDETDDEHPDPVDTPIKGVYGSFNERNVWGD